MPGGSPLQTWWPCKPRKELPSVPKLSSLPSIIHYWEELFTIFPLIIGSKNDLSEDNCCQLSWVWYFSLGSNPVKKPHNALGWIIEYYLFNYQHVWFVYWLDQFLASTHMIVVSHTSSHAILIFVAYLEKGKVLLAPKFLKCVCIHVGL